MIEPTRRLYEFFTSQMIHCPDTPEGCLSAMKGCRDFCGKFPTCGAIGRIEVRGV